MENMWIEEITFTAHYLPSN